MKRTHNEVLDELTAILALQAKLPNARRNLLVVEHALSERLTVDQVYDQYDTEDNEFQYALDTAMWLSGESDRKPSEGWD